MGGGVSSLPAEVSLAEAKELAGARWQPAWDQKFAEAKISRDEAIQCWKESEAKAAISEELYEKLHGTNRSGAAEALDFSAIINEKRGQHLPGTREWVFEAVLRWRTDADSVKLFWLVGGGGTGKSVAAAELLARLLDKQNAAAWHFCKHTEPARSAPAVLLRSLAGMLCATVTGFEDALKESGDVETEKVDELFEAVFNDLATGEPRLACAAGEQVRIYDPVAGGEALLVLDAGSLVFALAVFTDPATGAPRLRCLNLIVDERPRAPRRSCACRWPFPGPCPPAGRRGGP